MDERIPGRQDMPSLIIEAPPPQGPLNSQKYKFFEHFGSYMKNCFQLFSLVLHISPL